MIIFLKFLDTPKAVELQGGVPVLKPIQFCHKFLLDVDIPYEGGGGGGVFNSAINFCLMSIYLRKIQLGFEISTIISTKEQCGYF
jgi:hypothetical protein